MTLTAATPSNFRVVGDIPVGRNPTVIGRDQEIDDAIRVLQRGQDFAPGLVLCGPPGAGKTTLVRALLRRPEVQVRFVDGAVWIPIHDQLALVPMLNRIGVLMMDGALTQCVGVRRGLRRLRTLLRDLSMVLVVDEAKDPLAVRALRGVLSAGCRLVVTTQDPHLGVAAGMATDTMVRLRPLDAGARLCLVGDRDDQIGAWGDVSGLPLAATVFAAAAVTPPAGAAAPVDADGRAMVLACVDQLPLPSQERFALLGLFAGEPASLAVSAIAVVWGMADPAEELARLVRARLVEELEGGRVAVHPLTLEAARERLDGGSLGPEGRHLKALGRLHVHWLAVLRDLGRMARAGGRGGYQAEQTYDRVSPHVQACFGRSVPIAGWQGAAAAWCAAALTAAPGLHSRRLAPDVLLCMGAQGLACAERAGDPEARRIAWGVYRGCLEHCTKN